MALGSITTVLVGSTTEVPVVIGVADGSTTVPVGSSTVTVGGMGVKVGGIDVGGTEVLEGGGGGVVMTVEVFVGMGVPPAHSVTFTVTVFAHTI